jgi:DNA mismatch endonuclease (patch repair protein)
MPRNNAKLWQEKFEQTVRRDRRNLRRLKAGGWNVLILWECKLGDESEIRAELDGFLRKEAANSR